MAEPTVTRAALRRRVARRLRMPFARKVGKAGYATVKAGADTTGLFDTSFLVQGDDFWNKQMLFLSSANGTNINETREISDFANSGSRLTWLEPLGANVTTGDVYEIHGQWSAEEIHDALNDALRLGLPSYFDVTVDETLVVQRDTVEYTLPGNPYMVMQLHMQNVDEVQRGTATGGGATTLTDANQNWTVNEHANRVVSIYHGTGKGQYATIASNTATALTIAAWSGSGTTAPDTTSLYLIKDTTKAYRPWRRLDAARFDAAHWPSTLYLADRYARFEGQSLRVIYIGRPAPLTADTDTTLVPEEYLVPKALAILHRSVQDEGSKTDRQRHRQLADDYNEEAEMIKTERAWQAPHGTLWQESEMVSTLPSDYPFGS